MKVKDIIIKQKEYKEIQQTRNELALFRKDIEVLYHKYKGLGCDNITSRFIEYNILEGITNCRDELKRHLNEMEV